MSATTQATKTTEHPLDTETAARLRTAIGRLARRLRTTAAAREAGLTPTAISVLLTVARTAPIRMSELAESERINPTMLSRVTGGLVDKGLLHRTNDAEDRRAAWVTITRQGRRLTERMKSERTEAVNEAMGGLSQDERRRIEKALPALETLAEVLAETSP
jgi:DNA-binding MarR family transcriptional regulator